MTLLARIACIIAFALSTNAVRAESPPRVFLMNGADLLRTKQQLTAGDATLQAAMKAWRERADASLRIEVRSVMDKSMLPPSGDKHDYMSLGSYWWPNPKTENGLPYIRRDGERNPECDKFDARPMHAMSEAVQTLSVAYFYTDDEKYAEKAAILLRVWFLEPATKMNPHLKFGQSIPGICDGRALGIVDTSRLSEMVDCIGLLAGSRAWRSEDQKRLRNWFRDYLTWLVESKFGQDEADQPNNHATHYDVQVVMFSLFVDSPKIAREVLNRVAERRIAKQIKPDGCQPFELARTKAWGYSISNLTGMIRLATLAERFDIDLWRFTTADGRCIRKAIDWLVERAEKSKPFEYKQIAEINYDGFAAVLRVAANAYGDSRYEHLIARLPGVASAVDRLRLTNPARRLERDFSRWEPEISAYERQERSSPPAKGGVLFTGSSTIRLWKTLAEDFPRHNVINRGFGGSEIADATHFAERIIFPHEPRVILLRAGGNDIHNGKSPEEVFADFQDFVAKVHAKLPDTRIVFLSLSPAPARWSERDANRELNRLVERFTRTNPNLKFADTYDMVLDANNEARTELFVADQLHFNAEGYKLLAERVRPFMP